MYKSDPECSKIVFNDQIPSEGASTKAPTTIISKILIVISLIIKMGLIWKEYLYKAY
jgi:hypothetical protein